METVVINQIKDQSYTMKESLRALKTSISFSGKGVKSILFTSSVPNEGKTTVVMDLARSMADSKKSVLIVDTDMRKSVLVGRLRAKVESGGKIYGLSHYLSGQVSLDKVVYATNIKGVFILFAGHEVPNPTELLETKEFKELIEFGEKNFDYVLVDTPPTGAAIDAAVVGKNVDGAVKLLPRMLQAAVQSSIQSVHLRTQESRFLELCSISAGLRSLSMVITMETIMVITMVITMAGTMTKSSRRRHI